MGLIMFVNPNAVLWLYSEVASFHGYPPQCATEFERTPPRMGKGWEWGQVRGGGASQREVDKSMDGWAHQLFGSSHGEL